ncbi:unnamed protein product [Paramecium sonneborni]|uniref:Vacuolar protein sorting-associated protein 29 n=1 Tax=Paramecium sonneborni TaxID=65129 RepID=A0A8S1NNS1_9CILI|nr:unnamed protein product [Paramecium sonneborni]
MADEYDEEFGELGLVIGDFNIPSRASDLPLQFKELLVPNKVQYVFCTGNVGNSETTDWLKTLSGNTHIVKGDFDEAKDIPETKIIQIGSWRLALVHGHQVVPAGDDEALYTFLRELEADVLVTGHTGVAKVSAVEKKYIINPGSATGGFNGLQQSIPSFLILEFKKEKIQVFIYTLDGEVKIDKQELPLQK